MRGKFSWTITSVQRRWIYSYALVLLVPIIMMTAIYLQTQRVIEDEIYRANAALLSQFQQEVDNYMDYTYRLAEIISLNSKVAGIMRNQHDLGWTERLFMVEALADFKSYNIARRHVDHFYIYFGGGDFVLTESSNYSTEIYYRLYKQASGVSLNDWREYMAQDYRGQFVSKRQFSDGADDGIMYIQSLTVQHRGVHPATLVIELNQESLMVSIRNLQSYNQGHVYILGGNNHLLISSEERGTTNRNFDILDGLSQGMGTIVDHWDGEDVILSYIDSSRTDWKYVYVLPADLYSEKAQYVRSITFLILIIAIVIGSLLSILLAKRNYNPLRRLIRNVAERNKLEPLGKSIANEYDYLEETIEHALDRNTLMNRTIENQKKTLRSNLLVRILKGRIEDGFPLIEILPEYGIHFNGDDFAVILFYLEDYSAFFRQDEQDEEKKRDFVQLIMTNIVEELASQQHQGWMTEIDDMLACIINLKPATSPEAAAEDLKRLTEEARRFINNRFHILFTVAVSSINRSAAELPVAYQQAMEAMEYRMLPGDQTIIWYDHIKHQELSYSYSLEKEQQLINYVNAGDFPGAMQTLDNIIESNLAQENISVDMIRCLMFDMCSTMMKAAMEAKLEHSELYKENQEAIRELLNGSTVSAMRERMTVFIQKVCHYAEMRRKKSKLQLRENVQAYIFENYRNHNLSINMISEHFDVHPSYLSRYFKEQAGDNLTEYINKYRVEQSKALLQKEEILIKDISDLVGIYNINTFIRLFKKYEGVTPSAYRESKK